MYCDADEAAGLDFASTRLPVAWKASNGQALQGGFIGVSAQDGRTHHLRFSDFELTCDAQPCAVVEVRAYEDANGGPRLFLATRSDMTIEA